MTEKDDFPAEVTLSEFHDAFLGEVRELITAFETSVLALEADPDNAKVLNEAFRNAHSIKGASASVGHTELAGFTHLVEALLELWRDGRLEPEAEHFAVLLRSADLLTHLLEGADAEAQANVQETTLLLEELCGRVLHPTNESSSTPEAAGNVVTPGTDKPSTHIYATVTFDLDAFRFGGDPLLALRELLDLDPGGSVHLDDSRLPTLDDLVSELSYFSYRLEFERSSGLSEDDITEAFSFFGDAVAVNFIDGDHSGRRISATVHLDLDAFRFGGDALLALREIVDASPETSIRLNDNQLPPLANLTPESAYFSYQLEVVQTPDFGPEELHEAFSFFGDSVAITIHDTEGLKTSPEDEGKQAALPAPAAASQPAASPAAAAASAGPTKTAAKVQAHSAESATIRVSTIKIDRVLDLVGELVIAQSALREITRGYTPDRVAALNEAVLVAEQHLRELQERVMAVRMIPLGTIFSRLPRVVRDVARKLGKQVHLHIEGAETELDKNLVEQLLDPLMHLVRNAIDHGIEMPEQREELGKPSQATLNLRSFARSGNLFIEVEDDGRGIDTSIVRERAIERNWIQDSDDLSEAELLQLLCRPGFSTKKEATDISGRGVGLDVVQSNIQDLSGSLSISTEIGKGTRFTLCLPLTLTILDGLVIGVGGLTCVLPLTDVAFSLRLIPKRVRAALGAGEVLDLDDETLPLLDLAELLGKGGPTAERGELAIVVHAGNTRYALRVEKLLGQTQVVVKSIETHFRRVRGLMGATILGDGKVALILDGQALATNAAQGVPYLDGTFTSPGGREPCKIPQSSSC